jgi:hypothetical protein
LIIQILDKVLILMIGLRFLAILKIDQLLLLSIWVKMAVLKEKVLVMGIAREFLLGIIVIFNRQP